MVEDRGSNPRTSTETHGRRNDQLAGNALGNISISGAGELQVS